MAAIKKQKKILLIVLLTTCGFFDMLTFYKTVNQKGIHSPYNISEDKNDSLPLVKLNEDSHEHFNNILLNRNQSFITVNNPYYSYYLNDK